MFQYFNSNPVTWAYLAPYRSKIRAKITKKNTDFRYPHWRQNALRGGILKNMRLSQWRMLMVNLYHFESQDDFHNLWQD